MRKLIAGLYLASLLFGATTWVMLPFQLAEVYKVRKNAVPVNAKIIASYVYTRGKNCSLRISFSTPDNLEVTIGDALPGDIATCSRNQKIAGKFIKGKNYKFLDTGERYYIGHGQYWWSMLIALIGSIPYIYLLYSIQKNKRSIHK